MLIIEMANLELIGGHIGIMFFIEITKKRINRRPYCIFANYRYYQNRIKRRPYWIDANNKKKKKRINRRPYCIFANYRYYQNRIKRRPYWIDANINKIELTGSHIGFMLFIDISKIELTAAILEV